ncbi:MAG: hypothetical protein HYX78_10675 [Armatimonadetes bacterium]|nr:hypothetical protein [Armatimonadota bacterium]
MTLKRTGFMLAVAAVVAAAALPAAAREYFNVLNAPFATISNGPQNAIIVDVADPSNPAEVNAAVRSALGRVTRAAGSSIPEQVTRLRKAGLIKPDVHAFLDAVVLVRSAGSFESTTRAGRAYGGGEITFEYSGWDPTVQAKMKAFEQIAYPIVKNVYGAPAGTFTVRVVADTEQTVKDQLLGGVYVTGEGVQREIKIYPQPSQGVTDINRIFLHSIIHAFHDTAMFHYDAWEEGFARAASVVAGELIDKQIIQNPGSGLEELDLIDNIFNYMMFNYEQLNQPPLSNSTFYTSFTDMFGDTNPFGMIIPRIGMSSTAWIKAYVERLLTDGQSFFKLFNQQYYVEVSGNSGVAGNVPALKGIAASITPSVETLSFEDWFRRQYIFDTSVSIGKKLYAFVTQPDTPANPGTEGYSVNVFLVYYETTSTGDEIPLSGTVYPVYWDYQYKNDLYLGANAETVRIGGENPPGEGYVTPTYFVDNVGGPQRSAMDFTIGAETARVYFPAGKSGTAAAPDNFMGVVVGANAGSVTATVNAEVSGTSANVTNGAFGAVLSSLIGFGRLTITYTPATGAPVTKVVNAGAGGYSTVIEAPGEVKSLTNTFGAGLRMISVPMTTLAQDQAEALQSSDGSPVIPADRLLLARWNPVKPDAYKYEMYPRTPPFAPGRGYWAKLPSTVIATVTGETPNPAANWRIGLSYGWNQIGGPFETPVDVSTLLVEKGNDEPLPLSNAYAIVSRVIWKYVPGSGYVQATSLDPWEGYWIKCHVAEGAVLIVPGPDSKSRSRSASVPASAGGASRAASGAGDSWSMRLTATSPGGETGGVTLGVAAGATDGFDPAFDAELPPPFEKSTTIAAPATGRAGELYAIDTRAAGATKTSWDLVVTPSGPNEDVVVKWENIAQAPKQYRLVIVDESTGRSQYVRTTSSYRFASGDGSPRRLTVTADSSPSTRLMITNLVAGPMRGTSLAFTYNLTTDAQMSAEIVNPAGKPVRRLESGRPTRSGINSLSWDRRDDQGRSVSAGLYMLQLRAVTEEGEMVKTVRPVLVAR